MTTVSSTYPRPQKEIMTGKTLHLLHVDDDEGDGLLVARAVPHSPLPIQLHAASGGDEATELSSVKSVVSVLLVAKLAENNTSATPKILVNSRQFSSILVNSSTKIISQIREHLSGERV